MLNFWSKMVPGRGNCKCKGPEAGGVSGGRLVEKRAEKAWSVWGLAGHCKDFSVHSE